MKEDYLWDKTGRDVEIERLENALCVFRYQATAPPALPAKIIPFEKKSPRSFLRRSFAVAAFAALLIVCLGAWLQFSPKKIDVAKDSAETITPLIDKKISNENSLKKPDDLIVEKVEMPKQSVKRNIIKINKYVPAANRQNDLIARNAKVEKPVVKLTKEEKYAYDQLMLALSITSSKLKLVKDKIDRGEQQNIVRESSR